MITIEKIKVYKKYSGNIEYWDRFGKKKHKEILEYEEWELIDELIQNLELIEKGLASERFSFQTMNKLKEVCSDEKTQEELKNLIGKFE